VTGGRWSRPIGGAALLAVSALVPPVRHALESSMTAQMLGQLPLLVAAGALCAPAVPPALRAGIDRWNRGGIAGLLLASLVATFWMLPRSLDASTVRPLMALAKFLTVPFLIGLPFALSWPRMGFVLRGIFLAEVVATCFRLGWLYRVSPIRLCNNYGLDDQQRLGAFMLVLGGGLLTWLGWKVLMGGGDAEPPEGIPEGLSSEAAEAYSDARLRGLCHEGALEVALWQFTPGNDAGQAPGADRAGTAPVNAKQKPRLSAGTWPFRNACKAYRIDTQ